MAATIVVYAHDLEGGGVYLGRETQMRCDRAICYYHFELSKKERRNTFFVLGGGFLKSLPRQELSFAEFMRRYVEARGIPQSKIFLKAEGFHTISETEAVMELIREKKLPEQIVAVSSWYHIPRIRMIWRHRGYDIQALKSPMRADLCVFYKLFRECIALIATAAHLDTTRLYPKIQRRASSTL